MKTNTPDYDFLEYVVKALVDHPEDVKIERKIDEMGVLLLLKINPEDMGQIIGKEGSTIKAIRTLIRIIGLRNHSRISLMIEEPQNSTRGSHTKRESSKETELEDLKL